VRRTLMTIRAFNEAGRAFLLWTALKSDIAHRSADEKERQTADDILGLMTPILKGVMTDKGFDHAVMAQQVFGGHGYIEEHGMSQYVRDARIAMIYEGANGIQALDLVGRKLGAERRPRRHGLFKEIGDFCEENRRRRGAGLLHQAPEEGLERLQAATMWFMQNAMAKPDNAGAGSTDYMHLFGLVVARLYVGEDGQGRAGRPCIRRCEREEPT
jgi:acyl-CoA dehydrogenase